MTRIEAENVLRTYKRIAQDGRACWCDNWATKNGGGHQLFCQAVHTYIESAGVNATFNATGKVRDAG